MYGKRDLGAGEMDCDLLPTRSAKTKHTLQNLQSLKQTLLQLLDGETGDAWPPASEGKGTSGNKGSLCTVSLTPPRIPTSDSEKAGQENLWPLV